MNRLRKLTDSEIAALTQRGNFAQDWARVLVSDDFRSEQLSGCTLSGDVTIGSGTTISQSDISNYNIGSGCTIRRATAIECRQESLFGNFVTVDSVNENGGRRIHICHSLTAQHAYIAVMFRHRPQTVAALEALAAADAEQYRSRQGTIGNRVNICGTKFIRETNIEDDAVIDGCSVLENGTVMQGAKVGTDVKARNFIIAENATVCGGTTVSHCFVGESVTLDNGFTAAESLFFANSHCENGEAASVFAGPYTVSHHKSTLLIAGMFSFFNAGSASNQSNHLFKSGPVHQSIHLRGCKFASGAYIMSPAIEGPFTMIMGHHDQHHDTSEMPFSYLIEDNGRSTLLPAAALRSYGTRRDIDKWPKRDRRTVCREPLNTEEFNPYLTQRVVAGLAQLNALYSKNPDAEIYTYGHTLIRSSMLRLGISLYEKYIVCSLGSMIAAGRRTADNTVAGVWGDIGGQYISRQKLDTILERVDTRQIDSCTALSTAFAAAAEQYSDDACEWAYEKLCTLRNRTLSSVEIEEFLKEADAALAELRHMSDNDLKRECSPQMSVGYGVDAENEEQKNEDYKQVRGLN